MVRVPWYLLVAGILVPGLFSALVLIIALHANQRALAAEVSARRASELALCQLVTILDDAYKTTPPPTPTGKAVAAAMANLRVANRCP